LKPAPSKKARRAEDGDGFIRRNLRRLWRKMAWKTFEDWREAPPSVDSDWWHRHRQSMAGPAIHTDLEQGRGMRRDRPDYPSPNL
jgi:hypothetical protein